MWVVVVINYSSLLRWQLPGNHGFEGIVNKAIHPAAKIYLLHHVISAYVTIKMAVMCAKVYGLVIRNLFLLCEYYKEDIQ